MEAAHEGVLRGESNIYEDTLRRNRIIPQ